MSNVIIRNNTIRKQEKKRTVHEEFGRGLDEVAVGLDEIVGSTAFFIVIGGIVSREADIC